MSLRISLCTTCMNRINHLKKTLQKNIYDNRDYKNLEFVLLDYNSTDGLGNHIRTNMERHLENGLLKYFYIATPKYYNMSHSRNIAFKVASGDIVCNIDADNFTGKGFARYVSTVFSNNINIFLTTHDDINVKRDILGRICVRKRDFEEVNGYDEQMLHYGFDDYDFINRLQLLGLKKHVIKESRFLEVINHSDRQRINNMLDSTKETKVFIRYITPFLSEILLLFKGGKAARGTVVDNFGYNACRIGSTTPIRPVRFTHSLIEDSWKIGVWKKSDNRLDIEYHDRNISVQKTKENRYLPSSFSGKESDVYTRITDGKRIDDALFFYNQIANRTIMEKNIANNKIRVNENGYARGLLYMNFDPTPIQYPNN